ncbi:uncharacterized protein LOC132555678 [Ylistrum balloti]|uniref:uncharacterized protein LOC132555678 n=1 Tax=Ylistrum balloti TaxID=509963 RepID=UPI0029059881|nr:uncharacterized protein LOC132555678 [Ylistrum balloti]
MKIFVNILEVFLCLWQVQAVVSVRLDLVRGRTTRGTLPGMSIRSRYASRGATGSCSKGVVVKVNFAQSPCIRANHLTCGRRTPSLKVVVHLDRRSSRNGWLLNIGDSISNNGYGGDGGHNDNAAEIQAVATSTSYDITSYKRGGSVCQFAKKAFTDHYVVNPSVNTVTFYVADRSYRVTNDQGLDATHCSECLFALNGQRDTKGGNHRINKDIYLAFNRVISSSSRNGNGVCSVDLEWDCSP